MQKLAIHGGERLIEKYPTLTWPPTSQKTADKLTQLYMSRQWSFNSPAEQEFESAYAAYHGAKFGVFMANGTVTLECALEALGIGEGDEVIVPSLTWIATAMSVRYVGAIPVFADIEGDTLCLCPKAFEAAITPRTKAVIPVHLYGSTADLHSIIAIAKKHGIAVIEDCAHMQGGFWDGRGVGSWGEISSFSFQQSKTLAAGESGICLTNDSKLAELLYRCKHIGYYRYDKQGQAGTPPPVGLRCHNYRGNAMQALILQDQLEELPKLIKTYNAFRDAFAAELEGLPGVRLQARGKLADPQGFYALGIIFDGKEWSNIPLAKITEALGAEGMPVGQTYGPVYKHLLFNLKPDEYVLHSGANADQLCTRTAQIMHHNMYHLEGAQLCAAAIRKLFEQRGSLL